MPCFARLIIADEPIDGCQIGGKGSLAARSPEKDLLISLGGSIETLRLANVNTESCCILIWPVGAVEFFMGAVAKIESNFSSKEEISRGNIEMISIAIIVAFVGIVKRSSPKFC